MKNVVSPLTEKEITQLLRSRLEMVDHNLLCYSANYLLSEAKAGFEKEFAETQAEMFKLNSTINEREVKELFQDPRFENEVFLECVLSYLNIDSEDYDTGSYYTTPYDILRAIDYCEEIAAQTITIDPVRAQKREINRLLDSLPNDTKQRTLRRISQQAAERYKYDNPVDFVKKTIANMITAPDFFELVARKCDSLHYETPAMILRDVPNSSDCMSVTGCYCELHCTYKNNLSEAIEAAAKLMIDHYEYTFRLFK